MNEVNDNETVKSESSPLEEFVKRWLAEREGEVDE